MTAKADWLNEVLEALCDVLGQEFDGASPQTELGNKWCKRINYNWQEGETFEFRDALKLAHKLISAQLIRERQKEWQEILGEDVDKFYPDDSFHDFIKVPSHWINSRLADLTNQLKEVEDESS